MSDTHVTQAPDRHAPGHAAADDHGHDDHGHDGGHLGPIDWRMWGVGALGVISALAVTAGFVLATGFAFNA